jgi:DNA-binding FadR family transcriptional regulator
MAERRPVQYVIADDLRELILGRDLAGGAMLPSEAELAARYAVTRVTANRAVRVLRDEGLVVHRHSVGWFAAVTPLVACLHRVQDAVAAGRHPDPADVEVLAAVIPLLWTDRRSALPADWLRPPPPPGSARLTSAGLVD